ncbi:MAG: hypothetical protein AB7P69_28515 [Candidatus Binatia bacterium]
MRREVGVYRQQVWALALLCFLVMHCGDDLEVGEKKEGNLRVGKGDTSLHLGARSGGGKSGTRQIENTIVRGNIFNLRPVTTRPVLVFVFVDLKDFGTFQDFRDAEVAPLREDRSFLVPHLAAGDLTVVLLLDQGGANQDGTIDAGDPIAVFQDPTGRLQNLSAETETILEGVDVSFNLSAPETGIATVRSEANIIVTQQ